MTKRFAFWFALAGYFLTFLYYYGPWGLAYNGVLDHLLPFWMCILTIGGMPVRAVALVIAPINALLYGVVGASVGWLGSKVVSRGRSTEVQRAD